MPLTVLPEESAWTLPVADTRSPLSSVLLRSSDSGIGIDATLAADFPLLDYAPCDGTHVQVGLLAGAFMAFGSGGELTFDLQTFDGRFGLPVDVRSGAWAARAEWVHVSAHYGDGIRKSGQTPTNLDSYSREYVGLAGSRDFAVPGALAARVYVGGHALVHSLPDAPPFAVQGGGELEGPWSVAPYLAADVQLAQEFSWAPAVSAQLGARVLRGRSRFRVALAVRAGPDETGKSAGVDERWIGVVFGFDRTGLLAGL